MRDARAPVLLILTLVLGWPNPSAAQSRSASAGPTQIREWVAGLGDADTHRAAARELRRVGTTAVPFLLEGLVLARDELLADRIRDEAILQLLAALGPEARETVPVLIDLLHTDVPHIHHESLLRAVSAIGPYANEGLDALRGALETFRELTRIEQPEFFRAVSRLAVDNDEDLHAFIAGLQHPNAFVRELSAERLGRLGSEARIALPALAMALGVRHDSTVRLNGSGWSASLAADFSRYVHPAVACAMVRIAPESAECVPAFIYRLDDRDWTVRRDAAMALGRFGPAAARAVPALRARLRDEHLEVAREAITSLGMLGASASSAMPDLSIMMGDRDREIVARARVALRQIRNARPRSGK